MAFKKATVRIFPELKEVVVKLVAEYPVVLAEIQPDRILYLNSDAKSKRVARMTAIKVPHPSVTAHRFALTIYDQQWSELDEPRQTLHILRELMRIHDFEEARLGSYPLQDFPEIVAKYGVTWEDDEHLPNPLDKTATKEQGE